MPDLDLDTAMETPPRRRVLWPALVALLLAAAAAGAGTRALTMQAEPRPPVVGGRLTLFDAYLDPASGGAVATLRLLLQNDGATDVVVHSLTVDGLSPSPREFRLDRAVRPHRPVVIDLVSRAECAGRDGTFRVNENGSLTASISVSTAGTARSAADPPGQLAAPVLTSRGSGQWGGLCRELSATLPAGWRSPLLVSDISVGDETLRVGIRGLPPSSRIGGVWAGSQLLLAHQGAVASDGYRLLDVTKPSRCGVADDSARIPTGLRILAVEDSGLHEHYAAVGPTLATWLLAAC